MKTSKQLRQELGELTHQSRAILDRASGEGRARTGEEEAELTRMNDQMDSLEREIQTVEKQEQREARLSQPITQALRPAVGLDAEEAAEKEQRAVEQDFRTRFGAMGTHVARRMPGNPLATKAYRSAFERWLVAPRGTGVSTLSVQEQRDLAVGTGGAGGYTVPQTEFLAQLIKTVDDLAVIRGLATTFQVTQAQSLGAPALSADPSDPDWTTEILVGSKDSTMAFGKREMHPWPLAKYILVSDKLLRASPLGMEGIVRDRLAYKQAVAHSKAFNTGVGANQPLGLYTASSDGIDTDRDVEINTSQVIDPDKLIAARYTLRPGYWPNARWHFHRNYLSKFRQLKNPTVGGYAWQPGLALGAPSTFLDFPYSVDEYAPSATTGTVYAGMLGDFRNYWIVDALDIRLQRLDELFALTNQVAFVIRSETDGQPVNSDAFVRLKCTW